MQLKKYLNGLFFLGLVVVFLIVGWSGPVLSAEKVINWRMQSCWPPGMILYKEDERFVELVKQMTGGRLNIKLYSAGQLAGCYDAFQAAQAGSIEIVSGWSQYWEGFNSAMMILGSSPSYFSTMDYYNWYFTGGGKELAAKLYDKYGVHYLVKAALGPETGIWTNKPIKTIEDYKGLKMRIAGKIQGAVFRKLGGVPVAMATAELYEALRRGTIDGTETSMPCIDVTLGFAEVTKYVCGPSWWQSSALLDYSVNKKAWESLPDDIKKIVEEAAAANAIYFTCYYEDRNVWAFEQIEKAGVQVVHLDAASIAKLQNMFVEEIDKECAVNPDFAEIWNSQVAYGKRIKNVREWGKPWSYGETPAWLFK